jgi:chaperonin cofactor prefoldin
MRAMSLDSYGKEDEDNEINFLKNRLETTNSLVLALSKQIEQLSEKVSCLTSNHQSKTHQLVFHLCIDERKSKAQ